jgi:hypothetical protein
MDSKGFFITLSDEESLKLYLDAGIYSQRTRDFRQKQRRGESLSTHFGTLADFACARGGDYVFFFIDRTVYFGGRLVGPRDRPAFSFNGQNSPLVSDIDAPLVWDETDRDGYDLVESDGDGVFEWAEADPLSDGKTKRYCHPFFFQFEATDETGLRIPSDELYWALSDYPYPLMSDSISGRGFTPLTPGETARLLDVFEEAEERFSYADGPDVELQDKPTQYSPDFSITAPEEAQSEAHLEAEIIAKPELLPTQLQPTRTEQPVRQVPMTPYKPYGDQSDRADVCYYDTGDPIEDATLPNRVVELKNEKAGGPEARQAAKYRRWLGKLVSPEQLEEMDVIVYAPDFVERNFQDPKYAGDQASHLIAWEFADESPVRGNNTRLDNF